MTVHRLFAFRPQLGAMAALALCVHDTTVGPTLFIERQVCPHGGDDHFGRGASRNKRVKDLQPDAHLSVLTRLAGSVAPPLAEGSASAFGKRSDKIGRR